ncbi:hypothetical protein [Flammeovirga kamogawensis]|uniref:Uncharacterized protein n=1 Tax=Flammeovirga kamogawensis TaxID=373891 RepID=A0ABX8GWI4_9BACT|nr:hypothetical protein [Flammeovirga kamogawensis]MBB6461122.1 hypothetical protein [Flammeovirga kamogawensis]QWG07688.1 hypothetical protein KM029_01760 [Flammeovirga kamogawensis]TRX69497.1 hypothetical protein EO216_15700 [Flammeovirga kamogawensis]
MEKSIESIWKNGFINQEALVAPKINALYEKKSINFVDKFIRDFKINLWAILIFTIVPIIIGIVGNVTLLCLLINLQLWFAVFYGKKKIDDLKSLEKTTSSFLYIKQFDEWLKNTIKGYTNIYRFMYPLIFILSTIIVWETIFKQEVIANFDASELFMGLPIKGMLFVGIGAIIISLSAKKLYKIDMDLVYKSQFKKLEELISEMEELRNEE